MKVYQCINKVTEDLAKIGIAKGSENKQQGFKFRGIDDILNALAPLLSKHGLCVLPWVLGREMNERTTKNGAVMFTCVLTVEYAFVCAEDGSTHKVVTYGEAMDMGDKATNKAMSAAYKYAAIQAFCIPTEGDNDADAVTPEPIVATPTAPKSLITKSQLAHLQAMCSTTETKESAICEFLGIKNLAEMHADVYDSVLTKLNKKAKKLMESGDTEDFGADNARDVDAFLNGSSADTLASKL